MAFVVLAAVVVVATVAGALLARRRRPHVDVGQLAGPTFGVPGQVDRADFVRPDAPWLAVLFSAASCTSCADAEQKVRVLACEAVAVDVVDSERDRSRFTRYEIDSVPTVVICDSAGTVVRHHVGPISATDLWAMVDEARDGKPDHHPGC